MKKVLLVSNKFNYGHLASLAGWHRIFLAIGCEPLYWLADEYREHLDENEYPRCDLNDTISELALILINNIALNDSSFVRKMKKQYPDAKIIFIYHEPWRGLRNEINKYRTDIKHFVKQVGRMCEARGVVKNADLVICPSAQAMEFYQNHEAALNPKSAIYQLVHMDACEGEYSETKEYFSYIATAVLEKGIDAFVGFIKYASDKDKTMKFQLITASDVSKYIDGELQQLEKEGRLLIKHNKGLSEDEMGEAYDNSCCTWLAYRASTQSGVMVKALMWGSPCIATPVGEFQEIIDGKNGFIVEKCDAFQEILAAYKKIMEKPEDFYCAARKSYEKHYAPSMRSKELHDLLQKYDIVIG